MLSFHQMQMFDVADSDMHYLRQTTGKDCTQWQYTCDPPLLAKLATYSGGAFLAAYFLLYIYYMHRGFMLLRSRPYNSFRVGNVLVRLQVCIPSCHAGTCSEP